MVLILHDQPLAWRRLLPFTALKPISDLRVGILTLGEKWRLYSDVQEIMTYSSQLVGGDTNVPADEDCLIVTSHVLYSDSLLLEILNLKQNEGLFKKDQLIAFRSNRVSAINYLKDQSLPKSFLKKELETSISQLNVLEDIFLLNEQEITSDFARVTRGRKSQPISQSNRVIGSDRIFVEAGAYIENSILNPNKGYIYIGKDATILDGTMVLGSLAMNEKSVIKMGAKIYGATTMGIGSKLSGEVKNSVVGNYSNKGHEGYLGNAVLGDWCNLGADTNASNLKSNYSNVRIWDYSISEYRQSAQLFIGLMMGDHSKCSINTMFNTATVVGIGCNIYDAGFHPKFVPDFSWGTPQNYTEHRFEGFLKTAEAMMARKDKKLSENDITQANNIFKMSSSYRTSL